MLFGVSSSHSGQMDLSLMASSELVPDQAALDKIANVYFAQELDLLFQSTESRVLSILEEAVVPQAEKTGQDSMLMSTTPTDNTTISSCNNMQKG